MDKQTYVTRLHRWGWLALYMLTGIIVALTVLIVAPVVEQRYQPVVIDFRIDSMQRNGAIVTVRGTMDKVRDCRFVEIVAYARQTEFEAWSPVRVDFSPAMDDMQSRLPIYQRWGPWALTLHAPKPMIVKMAARHECHGMYLTTTQLITFEVP